MESSLEKASLFQEYVLELLRYLEKIPYQTIQIEHLFIGAALVICSFVSYRMGKTKENGNILSAKFKQKLNEFENDLQINNKKINRLENLIHRIYLFQWLCGIVFLGYFVYQVIIDYTNVTFIISIPSIILLLIALNLYKTHLRKSIKHIAFKIQQEKNQHQNVMENLLAEMSGKMKKILFDMISQSTFQEMEQEKETMKKTFDSTIKQQQQKDQQERDALKKQYELSLQKILATSSQPSLKCKTEICKKKKKLLKEKIKRNDWFIRNLAEFAWCQVCASNMFEDPSQSFIMDENNQEPSIHLDDSIMLNTTVKDESKEEKSQLFNKLQNTSSGQVIHKECENGCLPKYFFLCKKIGEKYNQWSELIDNFESKLLNEKTRLRKSNSLV